MGWLIAVAVIIFLAVVPYFAADSRDGADWKPSALGTREAASWSRPFSQSPGAALARRVAAWAHRALVGCPDPTALVRMGRHFGQHQHS